MRVTGSQAPDLYVSIQPNLESLHRSFLALGAVLDQKRRLMAEDGTKNEMANALVVDDEPQIVNFQKQVLERLGYRVKAETDSMAALETFGSAPGTFDAVVTDMTMPQMTGDKLVRELRKIRPDIPIILCTGYSDKISKKKAKEMGINAFLMKPVGTVDLTGTLRRILDN